VPWRPRVPMARACSFLNIGEPDFTAPPLVQAAAQQAIAHGHTAYTPAMGLLPLRERLSHWYAQRFGVDVPAQRIVITAGASAALHLACLALFDPGTEVLMPDPSYPCNRHILASMGARAVLIPTTAAQRYQPDAEAVARHWGAATRGVLLASPSNPTGTSIDPAELARIHAVVQGHGGCTLVDEIYLGLSHDERYGQTALQLGSEVVSINSFSKYFNMTGWRLGWLVVPESLVEPVERLAQNLYICASSVSQQAALACFEPDSLALYEQRRAEFKRRRDAFVPALRALGFGIATEPDGAFYVWADASPLFGLAQGHRVFFGQGNVLRGEAEHPDAVVHLDHLAVQRRSRRRQFFHHGRVLLGDRVEVRHRFGDLRHAQRLFAGRMADVFQQAGDAIDRGHGLVHAGARFHRAVVARFHAGARLFDEGADFLGRGGGALRQRPHFGGHHGKAPALLASAGGFHGRVQAPGCWSGTPPLRSPG
jgi:aspartate/methionine/tyrosine aminotransferase